MLDQYLEINVLSNGIKDKLYSQHKDFQKVGHAPYSDPTF